jgi:predicted transposase/invertase (TIGR01784 family)
MTVNGQLVDLEIQVNNEGDYPERSLFYWAKIYSASLNEGMDYRDLPRAIVISILAFKLFDCPEFHSEFRPLEVTRHTQLTDRMSLHYFELPKIPKIDNADDELGLWLTLFKAKTEDDLKHIEVLGGEVMEQAISAYRHVTATDKFKETERLRLRARSNEASALRNARTEGMVEGAETEREKWQDIVAEKELALLTKETVLTEQATAITEKDLLIAQLQAKLNERS